ncbi:MAG: 2-oxo acid dehydrogenase subunit E2, partial [Verrucomicrobia bacterium]|nr:2-oxo acid dehydrogenase subunit E2 [Verrucomicrobiota bacterium]
MPITIEMPKLSDTMTEGTLLKWLKKVGDKIEIGDVLAEVETDKATMEMEAFDQGTLGQVYVEAGQKVEIGQKLAILLEPGEESGEQHEPKSGAAAAAPQALSSNKATDEGPPPASNAEKISKKEESGQGERLKASPLARKMAAELKVDLAGISGSGPGGRIVRADVLAASNKQTSKPLSTEGDQQKKTAAVPSGALPPPPQSGPPPAQSTPSSDRTPSPPSPVPDQPVSVLKAAGSTRIPLSGMRKTIASRLLQAKTTIPHFYLQAEINAEPLTSFRQQINPQLDAAGLGKITVNDFVLKATAIAATRVPQANASFDGDAILQYGSVQLACAVAIDEGLVTPVIRDAQNKSLGQISNLIKDLATRARSKKLKPEEYQGGTIT